MRGTALRGLLVALGIPLLVAGCATKKPETEIGVTGTEIGPFSDDGILVEGQPVVGGPVVIGEAVPYGQDPFGQTIVGQDGSLVAGEPIYGSGGGSLVDGALAGDLGGTVVYGPDGQAYDLDAGVGAGYNPGLDTGQGYQPANPAAPAYAGNDARFPGDDGTAQYFSLRVGDRVFFGTDRYDISPDAREVLQRQAAWLQIHTGSAIVIEGHADERGTREYNLALGARRANAVRSYLVSLGVPRDRISTVSYGKERPVEACSAARCWNKNRRAVTAVRGGFS